MTKKETPQLAYRVNLKSTVYVCAPDAAEAERRAVPDNGLFGSWVSRLRRITTVKSVARRPELDAECTKTVPFQEVSE